MQIELLLYIGGLALLDTLSPTIVGVTLFLILASNRKNLLMKLFFYLLTVVILYFLLGIVMMVGANYFIDSFSNILLNRFFSWTIFIIGLSLFTSSFFISPSNKKNIPIPKDQSFLSIIFIGITTFFIEAGTALPYFTAIGLLTTNDVPMYQWLSLLASYNLIMVSPVIILFLLYKTFGKYINNLLTHLMNKLTSNSNSTLSWVMCIVGLILIFNTLDYL